MDESIKNQFITVTVKERGAELCSIKNTEGAEFIWQADPRIRGRHSPILFPLEYGANQARLIFASNHGTDMWIQQDTTKS